METHRQLKNSKWVRLLGINLQEDLSWRAHLSLGEKPLIPSLRKVLCSIIHIGKQIPREGKLSLVNGLIMSRVIYCLPVWGRTNKKHLSKLQAILNKAARFISSMGPGTKTQTLMESCNWLTIYELVKYHSTITLWKMLQTNKPTQMSSYFSINTEMTLEIKPPRIKTVEHGFRVKTTQFWNQLPTVIRTTTNLSSFKRTLKIWIITQREPTQYQPNDSDSNTSYNTNNAPSSKNSTNNTTSDVGNSNTTEENNSTTSSGHNSTSINDSNLSTTMTNPQHLNKTIESTGSIQHFSSGNTAIESTGSIQQFSSGNTTIESTGSIQHFSSGNTTLESSQLVPFNTSPVASVSSISLHWVTWSITPSWNLISLILEIRHH